MSAASSPRHTAEERREEILAAAIVRFGKSGLHGTSTEAIARDVGISQPYLFRLFGTKKQLFIAAVEWGFRETLAAFQRAGREADDPGEAFKRMGDAYVTLIADRRYLDIQMQAYVATDDAEIRAVVREGFGALAHEIVRHTRATPSQLAAFLGRGMLLNVTTLMGIADEEDGWPAMVRTGCLGGFEE